MDPCSICGRKPNRARRIFHKPDCPNAGLDAGMARVIPVPEPLDTPVVFATGRTCCNQPMTRTDGRPYDAMCRHFRLLSGDCAECRKEHNGIITYRCAVCGRQVQDSPGIAQGPAALNVSLIARCEK